MGLFDAVKDLNNLRKIKNAKDLDELNEVIKERPPDLKKVPIPKINPNAENMSYPELLKAISDAKERGDDIAWHYYNSLLREKLKKVDLNEPKKQEKSGDCFITTAVCDTFNKPDDCYELTAFRNFRDNWLAKQEDGASLIQKYYDTAPAIVEKINSLPNARAIYLAIWAEYLKPCLAYIEQKNFIACKQKYIQMVESLAEKY